MILKNKQHLIFFVFIAFGLFIYYASYQIKKPFVIKKAAIWVPRFDYQSADDIKKILKNINDVGFTDVFFQIRGNGTVFYPSKIEPWAHDLHNGDINCLGLDPGWNPLQLILDEADKYNINVHAYINVLPGWKGASKPKAGIGQPWADHPEWFMVDANGNIMQPTTGWYTFLNPAHPEVINHLSLLINEIIEYDVKGIHLDYIRYPYDYLFVVNEVYPSVSKENLKSYADFSYDIHTYSNVINFSRIKNKTNRIKAKSDIISSLVDDFNKIIKTHNPNLILSASVLGNLYDAELHAGQAPQDWLKNNSIDWVIQMNYEKHNFRSNAKAYQKRFTKKQRNNNWIIGITADQSLRNIKSQFTSLSLYKCKGVAIFSYGLLFENHRFTLKSKLIKNLLDEYLISDLN